MKKTLKAIIKMIPGTVFLYHLAVLWWRKTKKLNEFLKYGKAFADGRFECKWKDRLFCVDDATTNTGFDHHYLYHAAWAARIIAVNKPPKHVDISSSIPFVGIASAFIPFEFYDYRPAELTLSNIKSAHADITKLDFADNSIVSLSSMHVVEHIGLGRYGDPIDPHGDLKAIRELQRVLAPGGTLLFVVPVGKPLIQFNAHRIYSYELVEKAFHSLKLKSFSMVDDDGNFLLDASPALVDRQKYACGCFEFIKEAKI